MKRALVDPSLPVFPFYVMIIIVMKQVFGRIIRLILAIFVWFFIVVDTLLVFIVIAILKPLDRRGKISYRIANFWGRSIVELNPFWDLKTSGQNYIKDNHGYVLVANHSSLADIVCLYYLGKQFKWIAKSSLFKIPVFGWTMSLLNYIPLKRGKHGSIRDSFQEAQDWLEKDVPVLIFPEGTRSRSGALSEFKNGAFKLAIRTKKPIIPIVIRGTNEVLSKGKATMSGAVKGFIKVLPPINTSQYQPEQHEALKTKVWDLMNQELTAVPETQ